MSQRRLIPLAIATALALSACGSDESPTSGSASPVTTTDAVPSTSADPVITTAPTKAPPPSVLTTAPPPSTIEQETTVPSTGSPTDIAIADLADRLDVDPAEIEVVSVEEVTWPDGGLGCPEPGMSYAQALVNGSRIVLAVDGTEYEYHSGPRRDPFYCPPERVTPPATGGYGDI